MRIGRYEPRRKPRRGRGITESRHAPTYRIHAPIGVDATSPRVRLPPGRGACSDRSGIVRARWTSVHCASLESISGQGRGAW